MDKAFLDPSAHNALLGAETRLLTKATFKAEKLDHPHAYRHIKEGFIQRHMMMQTARTSIYEAAKNVEGALPDTTRVRMNIYLNSFYLNLRGAVDNLTWALAYELSLRDDLDEDNKGSQYFCYLFGEKFLTALEDTSETLTDFLRPFREWFDELKELRDPAAHRIPLTFPGSVLLAEEGEEWQEKHNKANVLSEKALKAREQGKHDQASELLDESFSLQNEANAMGRFLPIIVTSEASGHEFKSGPLQLQKDQLNFLKIGRKVIAAL